MINLYKHNLETYEKLREIIKTNNKTCAIQPTGSGKSYLILKLVEDYSEQERDIIIIEPQKFIFEQLQKKMNKYGLPVENVKFVTYSALGKLDEDKANQFISPNLVLIDEMHRAGAKTWRSGLQKMFDSFPNDCKYIGFSATPIRFLDGKRNMAEELFNGCIANEIGLADAILNRILPLPRYIAGLYTYDNEVNAISKKIQNSHNTDEEKEKLLEEVAIMKKNLDKSKGISSIFKKYINQDKGKYIAFCRNINHLKQMRPCLEKWFLEAGIDVNLYEVHCKNPEKDKQFNGFMNDDKLSVCLSVAMLSEGIHGIDGVILLRDTISPNLYYQQIGRVFAIDMDTVPIIFDLVANCESIIMDYNLKNDLLNVIDRRDKENTNYNHGFNDNTKRSRKKITKEDIKKFFVYDQVMDSVRAFRDIEDKLKDSWNLYIEALEQYKEREGDCLASRKHIEVVNGVNIKLGAWIGNMRCEYKKAGSDKLTEEKKIELNRLNFIWDERRYVFENNIRKLSDYYNRYGKYPSVKAKDLKIRKLGIFICKERTNMRKGDYQGWKIKIINEHLPAFNSESISDLSFKKFIFYLEKFKNQYGHVDIKQKCEIDGYHIGSIFSNLKQQNISGTLSKDKKKKLLELGLCIENKFDENFNYKMVLAKQAINDGIVISKTYQEYRGINLKNWISQTVRKKYIKNELSKEEIHIIEELVKKPINKLFNNGNYVKIVDILDNKDIAICSSYNKAVVLLNDNFNLKVTEEIIFNRMKGKVKSPYKKRFMFYPVDDETIRKLCTNNIKQLIFVQDK